MNDRPPPPPPLDPDVSGDIRLDEWDQPWQACPRCGLERHPSANGIRWHDEFCNGPLQPFMLTLTAHGLVPFQREPWVNPRTGRVEPMVLGEVPAMRWRVGAGMWYRLQAWARYQHDLDLSGLPATLFGWPIAPDPDLPSQAVVFEGVSA